jgi:hypothetical protein
MFALVESGNITQMPKGNKGITLNNIQYPSSIYTLWSETERNAIGIYTVEIDNTNKKNEEWYVNTNQTYTFSGGKVKATYGTATAKKIADTLWTEQDKTDGKIREGEDVGDVSIKGLKTIKKEIINNQCAGILAPSDWRVVKATETGGTMDSGWKTWRASVRTKCNSMQTQIDNASDVDALAALFTYTTTDGVTSRPLGEFPIKE